MTLLQCCIDTNLGGLYIVVSEKHVHGIYYTAQNIKRGKNAITECIISQLIEYLAKVRYAFNIPIAYAGTELQKKVWKALQQIPYGETRTYSEIATMIGNPRAYRAVATAIAKNPIVIIIPCHRVIRKNGDIGEYVGGAVTKRTLLDTET